MPFFQDQAKTKSCTKCKLILNLESFLKLKEQEFKCFYCQQDLTHISVHRDHYIPLSKGGTNDINNIVCTCAKCNNIKGNKLPEQFIKELKLKLQCRIS